MSLQPESLVTLLDIETILAAEITFGETQVMNGIQAIGLANSITATNTYNAFCEPEFLLEIVLELKKRYGLEL